MNTSYKAPKLPVLMIGLDTQEICDLLQIREQMEQSPKGKQDA
ncbi:hypothetical protein [Nitrincola iocasae]|nr:hypothetical protein [Nitrincola iocasae]